MGLSILPPTGGSISEMGVLGQFYWGIYYLSYMGIFFATTVDSIHKWPGNIFNIIYGLVMFGGGPILLLIMNIILTRKTASELAASVAADT